ncbi:MAG: DHH family phosphoesterase, partial [Candidatus Taylorbacteria bacterium]
MSFNIRKPLTVDQRNQYSGMSDTVAHLLFHRGITDSLSAQKFIEPDYEASTHDPFLLKDAEKSAIRIILAIENNERIAVYSDYDADGIPGAAIFNDFFKRIGYKNYSIYIPHRHDEGFGVNVDAVMQLAGDGVKLLITIDCGITDVEPIRVACEKGIDVIVTDHHEPPTELPPAFAIIDHKQADCKYPDKNLCGSGVAYKLIQAILKKNRLGLKEGMEKWLLDLVGIATMSDMVPLLGENRTFAHYGLAVLRKSPRKGIMQLLRKLGINQRHLTEDDIAFMITPRINAASRMGVPMDAFKLLSADNDDDAYTAANHLDKINNERKGVVASLVKEVKKILHARYGESSSSPQTPQGGIGEDLSPQAGVLVATSIPAVIVLGNPDWRPSLLGLVANTVAEEYDRPVFL